MRGRFTSDFMSKYKNCKPFTLTQKYLDLKCGKFHQLSKYYCFNKVEINYEKTLVENLYTSGV